MKGNDVALIQRTLDGDESAFTVLVKKYQKWVHTLVWRKIGDFHIAEELTQDIFLKVYKKLSTLKPPDHFPGWLYVIATRHCIAWLRKKQLPTTSLDAMPAVELETLCYAKYEMARGEEASIEQQRECVKRLLQKLPESERTVVTLYYLAEMTSEEVSAFLGVSPNTIRSRLRRARERLEKQEHLLHDVSGVFRVPPTLTENIMREIANIKPTSPSASKPWLPWGLSFASTLLVILMVGFGTRALSRFQQPYNLDATSEMTIELVEAPAQLALERKQDLRNQYGLAAIAGLGNGGLPINNAGFLAAAQADTVAQVETKPEWMPAKGPSGGSVNNLFVTAQKDIYAMSGARLYRLTDENSAEWTLINAGLPTTYTTRIAERNGTLYIADQKQLFVSIDRGATLTPVGPLPQGRAVALLITDPSQARRPQEAQYEMYLVLTNGVFRSTDAGKTWHAFNEGLTTAGIKAAAVIDNALFLGTNPLFLGTKQGLYRLNTGVWEKLPVVPSQTVHSLAVHERKLYRWTRGEHTWHDTGMQDAPTLGNYYPHDGFQFAVSGKGIYLGKSDGSLFQSSDGGDTWRDITATFPFPLDRSKLPLVQLSEVKEMMGKLPHFKDIVYLGRTVYIRTTDGAALSTDGENWHLLTNEKSVPIRISELAVKDTTLYGASETGAYRLDNETNIWIQIAPELPGRLTSLVATDDALYVGTGSFGILRLPLQKLQ